MTTADEVPNEITLENADLKTTRTKRHRYLSLVLIWAVAALGLWIFLPLQPRLVLNVGDIELFIAVTPDSRNLITMTRHIDSFRDFDYREFESRMYARSVQVWDLSTGQQRRFELPLHESLGQDPSPLESWERSIDPDLWQLSFPQERLSGRICRFVQENHYGERWAIQLDIDRGMTTKVRLPDAAPFDDVNSLKTSSKGRWIALVVSTETDFEFRRTLTIIDSDTGSVTGEFPEVELYELYFSDDETMFVIADLFAGTHGRTTIWQLEPLKRKCSFDRIVGNIRFSPDGRSFACTKDGKICLIDVQTGETLRAFPFAKTRRGSFSYLPGQFRFSPDGRLLIGYAYFHGMRSGPPPQHCDISEAWAWDLETGTRTAHLFPSNNTSVDPNLSHDGLSDRTTPQLLRDEKRLFDLETDRTLLQIPEKTSIELTSAENGVAILKRECEGGSAWNRMLLTLARAKMPIPAFLRRGYFGAVLHVCEIPSGRIRRTLPCANYVVSATSLAMTPDGHSLITTSSQTSNGLPIIHVWDITVRHSFARPLLWSLVVPIGWFLWRFIPLNRASQPQNFSA